MTMPVVPKPAEIVAIGETLGIHYTPDDVAFMSEALAPFVMAANAAMRLHDHTPPVRHPRTPGYRPGPEEDPLNGWYHKTEVKGAEDGPLKGKTVALKDNVLLAGVPMMNGASMNQQYVPEVDATVATRLLDAGATILGKANIPGIGVSFGTKHLHFWSKAFGRANPYPIYDKNIYQLLRAEINNNKYPSWNQYSEVVYEFESLAEKIGAKPEYIEKALFAYYSNVGIKKDNIVSKEYESDENTVLVNSFLNERILTYN